MPIMRAKTDNCNSSCSFVSPTISVDILESVLTEQQRQWCKTFVLIKDLILMAIKRFWHGKMEKYYLLMY